MIRDISPIRFDAVGVWLSVADGSVQLYCPIPRPQTIQANQEPVIKI